MLIRRGPGLLRLRSCTDPLLAESGRAVKPSRDVSVDLQGTLFSIVLYSIVQYCIVVVPKS